MIISKGDEKLELRDKCFKSVRIESKCIYLAVFSRLPLVKVSGFV